MKVRVIDNKTGKELEGLNFTISDDTRVLVSEILEIDSKKYYIDLSSVLTKEELNKVKAQLIEAYSNPPNIGVNE